LVHVPAADEGVLQLLMPRKPSRKEKKAQPEARLPMRHEACGGSAVLTISILSGNVTYKIHCHDCGYDEGWAGEPPGVVRLQ